MQRVFASLFLLLYFVGASGQQPADDLRRSFLDPSGAVMVAAHRGAHQRYPENSLAAIQDAIRLGVDIVEIDVKVSRDGVPFLMHDRTMDRTTNGTGDPETYSWEELQRFNLEDMGKSTSLKIPSLEQALNVAKGKILVDLDLKTDRIGAVIDVVQKTNTEDIVIFFDSDFHVLTFVQKSNEDFLIMPRVHSTYEADSAVTLFDPPVVHIDFNCYSEECVALIEGSYSRIWINALGELDEDLRKGKAKRSLKKLLSKGANIIQTDEPELLLKILKRKSQRSESTTL